MTGGGLMRIRNDYTGFSGKGYPDNYLYKNKEAAKENDSQADRTKPDGANTENTVYRKRESTYSRDGDVRSLIRLKRKLPGKIPTQGSLRSSGILLEMRDRQRRQEGSLSILWLLSRI